MEALIHGICTNGIYGIGTIRTFHVATSYWHTENYCVSSLCACSLYPGAIDSEI